MRVATAARWARANLTQVAVAVWVGAALMVGLIGLWHAVREFDYRADVNASLGYFERVHGRWLTIPTLVRDPFVVERAVVAIPEDAQYRVVTGPDLKPMFETKWSPSLEEDFLRFYLLPRRETDDESAAWVLCLQCDIQALGSWTHVVASGPGGTSLVRVRE